MLTINLKEPSRTGSLRGGALALVLAISSTLTCLGQGTVARVDDIQLTFLSQRSRTLKEMRKDEGVLGLKVAARFRLSNNSDSSLAYLASVNRGIVPFGSYLYRKLNSEKWQCHPECTEEADLNSLISKESLRWLELPSKAAVEFEVFDSKGTSLEERGFLAFLRVSGNDKLIKLISNPYK